MKTLSWTLANRKQKTLKNGEIAASCKAKKGKKAYVICPDGNVIEEKKYAGSYKFGGEDIYELILDWNKADVKNLLVKAHPFENKAIYYTASAIMSRHGVERADAYIDQTIKQGLIPEKMKTSWRHDLGKILYETFKETLPFPVKITDTPSPRLSYADLPASALC